ncbi:MAG: hypothetical protein EBS48_11445, partial [Actinobacteria bacterium]|nr:hypothetical protein [Actinomycetota bacterium]
MIDDKETRTHPCFRSTARRMTSTDLLSNPVQNREYRLVLRECARWGVRVRYADVPPGLQMVHSGPLWGSIHWPTRTIFWEPGCPFPEGPSALLHELAHCLAHTRPSDTDEIESGMLAVEYEAARRLKLTT